MSVKPNAFLRLWKCLFIEHRLPTKCYQFLKRFGLIYKNYKKEGFKIKAYSDSYPILRDIWDKKVYDIPIFKIKKDMNIIDIGANQGFFSLYAASMGANVYAVEPCKENFSILNFNITENKLNNLIKTFNQAISDKNGKIELFIPLDSLNNIKSVFPSTHTSSFQKSKKIKKELVSSITLDMFLSKLHIKNCDLLKMDCEGAEYEILKSTSPDSFNKIKRIVMEVHFNHGENIIKLLEKAGFRVIYYENEKTTSYIKAIKADI